jgi:hypothetical protein
MTEVRLPAPTEDLLNWVLYFAKFGSPILGEVEFGAGMVVGSTE